MASRKTNGRWPMIALGASFVLPIVLGISGYAIQGYRVGDLEEWKKGASVTLAQLDKLPDQVKRAEEAASETKREQKVLGDKLEAKQESIANKIDDLPEQKDIERIEDQVQKIEKRMEEQEKILNAIYQEATKKAAK